MFNIPHCAKRPVCTQTMACFVLSHCVWSSEVLPPCGRGWPELASWSPGEVEAEAVLTSTHPNQDMTHPSPSTPQRSSTQQTGVKSIVRLRHRLGWKLMVKVVTERGAEEENAEIKAVRSLPPATLLPPPREKLYATKRMPDQNKEEK